MFSSPQTTLDPDKAIRSTDDDAAHARISAVRKGYLTDPYISLLVQRPHSVVSRPPLINIGTYIRSQAIDNLISNWIDCVSQQSKVQIVSLGAGSDSRFWRLMASDSKGRIAKYVEIDLPENIFRKGRAVQQHTGLKSVVGEGLKAEKGGLIFTSTTLILMSADLRRAPSEQLAPLLSQVNTQLPTLFLSECVFPYIDPAATDMVIRWCTSNFPSICAVSYDMFGLNDSFGRVMLENLKIRGIELPGTSGLDTLADINQRYVAGGFTDSRALTLKDIRANYLAPEDLARVMRLELLDEVEELDLVLQHYAIAWAYNVPPACNSINQLTSWVLSTG